MNSKLYVVWLVVQNNYSSSIYGWFMILYVFFPSALYLWLLSNAQPCLYFLSITIFSTSRRFPSTEYVLKKCLLEKKGTNCKSEKKVTSSFYGWWHKDIQRPNDFWRLHTSWFTVWWYIMWFTGVLFSFFHSFSLFLNPSS